MIKVQTHKEGLGFGVLLCRDEKTRLWWFSIAVGRYSLIIHQKQKGD